MISVTPADLAPFAAIEPAKAAAMIESAVARAALVAPCLALAGFPAVSPAARGVIVGVILRWNDAGSGAVISETAGPFAVTREAPAGLFRPTEIAELQAVCRAWAAAAPAAAQQAAGPRFGGPPAPSTDPLYRAADRLLSGRRPAQIAEP